MEMIGALKRVLKIVIPSIMVFLLVYLMRGGKNILDGIYIVFPLMYIAIGVICSDFLRELLGALLLSTVAFIIPINIWYHMGMCVELALIYAALGCISYFIKRSIKKKLNKKL